MSVRMGKCALCDKPAVGAVNVNASATAPRFTSSEPVWELRCDEHNPYWNPKRDADRLAALYRVLTCAENLLRFPNKDLVPWTEWHDLRAAVDAVTADMRA